MHTLVLHVVILEVEHDSLLLQASVESELIPTVAVRTFFE